MKYGCCLAADFRAIFGLHLHCLADAELGLFSDVPLLDRTQVAYDARINFALTPAR